MRVGGANYTRRAPSSLLRLLRAVLVGTQDPIEERPRPVPGVNLRGRVHPLQGVRVHPTAERVSYRRPPRGGVDVDLGLRQSGLERGPPPPQLLVLDVVDVL